MIEIQQVSLNGTDIDTTPLGFGCAELLRLRSSAERQRLLAAAYDSGIRHFDVAPMYGFGAAESELARFTRTRRSDVTITTKFGISMSPIGRQLRGVQRPLRAALERLPTARDRARGPQKGAVIDGFARLLYDTEPFDAATARAGLERSLRILRTDHVDVFLLHEPEAAMVRADELREYLESARSAGMIRAWGVAGEPWRIVPVLAGVGGVPVVQTRWTPGGSLPTGSARITYGALTGNLQAIVTHLAQHPERRRDWLDVLGVDCGQTDVTAAFLFAAARRANPQGVLLLGTASRRHLAKSVDACAAPVAFDVLDRFEDLIAEATTSDIGEHR